MRLLLSSVLALGLAFSAPAAFGESPEEMMLRMETAMADAQAQAVREGDEALTCEQLEAEMVVTLNDPAVQTQMAANGAWAQGQLDAANAARGQALRQMGMSMALGFATSFIPGGGYAQMAGQRAQGAIMQAQAQQNMSTMMAQAEGVMTIMPQIMRGQRLYELGAAQQCSFAQEMDAEGAELEGAPE